MRTSALTSLGMLLLALGFADRGSATTIVAKTLDDLCTQADYVFVGTVGTVRSQWADESHSAIETAVTFTDLDPLYGTGSADLTLRFGGGEMGDIREQVAGVPAFVEGERVIVFAYRDPSVSPIVGFNQGYLRIADGPSGSTVTTADRRPLVAASPSVVLSGKADALPSEGMALDQFLGIVRKQLETRRGVAP